MSQHVAQGNEVLQGRYAIERELSGGSMATVDLALDLTLHRHFPLKVLDRVVAAPLAPSVSRERSTWGPAVSPQLPRPLRRRHDHRPAVLRRTSVAESLRERLACEPQLPSTARDAAWDDHGVSPT